MILKTQEMKRPKNTNAFSRCVLKIQALCLSIVFDYEGGREPETLSKKNKTKNKIHQCVALSVPSHGARAFTVKVCVVDKAQVKEDWQIILGLSNVSVDEV